MLTVAHASGSKNPQLWTITQSVHPATIQAAVTRNIALPPRRMLSITTTLFVFAINLHLHPDPAQCFNDD